MLNEFIHDSFLVLELDAYAHVHGLADGILVGAIVLGVGEAVEMIPCDKVVGVYIESALAHPHVLDPLKRKRIAELYILQTAESTVLEEE